jgi:hypothetical protein
VSRTLDPNKLREHFAAPPFPQLPQRTNLPYVKEKVRIRIVAINASSSLNKKTSGAPNRRPSPLRGVWSNGPLTFLGLERGGADRLGRVEGGRHIHQRRTTQIEGSEAGRLRSGSNACEKHTFR